MTRVNNKVRHRMRLIPFLSVAPSSHPPKMSASTETPSTAVSRASTFQATKPSDSQSHHVLIALDASPESSYAFEWALRCFIDPKKHVLYLLSVAKVNPKASMIYSAGIGKTAEM